MQPVKTKKKLSRADKKQIEAAIARANRTDKKGKSAQDSISYERMWPDGICRVSDSHYTKTIQFQDINYQLSQNEDKTAIFEGWCDFLNYFDSSIHFQLSFLNLAASEETFANSISIPPQRDAFDSIREEYTTMLQNQLARGNNGLIKTKYLTFGIDADSIKAAKPRLERIETDILNNFKRLGVAARTLDGKERLFQLYAVFHIHNNLRINMAILLSLMRKPPYGYSAEYADNRISLFSAQWGKCAVTGEEFSSTHEIHCHHKLPRYLGGDDSYGNLILVKDSVHKLIHAINADTIAKYLELLQLDKSQLKKVNTLRELASLPLI